jgi:chemotaxis protein MotA
MLSSVVGTLLLVVVVTVSLIDRGQAQISYFDWHAAIVVLGGVAGSVLLAIRGSSFIAMWKEWLAVVTGRSGSQAELKAMKDEFTRLEKAWTEGRRAEVLGLVESSSFDEVRVASESLIQHLQGQRLAERFEELRAECSSELLPQIEGWDMIARLGPSFGIVGTVAGMIQLFRNMASQSGNLGGAMAMALLATLYGILLGTAIGGPMSTRANQVLNERLALIDLFEMKIAALVEESRLKSARSNEALA